jgi:hypothetical protein
VQLILRQVTLVVLSCLNPFDSPNFLTLTGISLPFQRKPIPLWDCEESNASG